MSKLAYKLKVSNEESGMSLPPVIEVITFYPEEVVCNEPGSVIKTVLPLTILSQMYTVQEAIQVNQMNLKETMTREIEAIRERCVTLESLVATLNSTDDDSDQDIFDDQF